ncbi:hypothetical protein OAS39_00480 [Pirellulales bacterium]|nr:hypothetical protein [Pirellulales bacterium]
MEARFSRAPQRAVALATLSLIIAAAAFSPQVAMAGAYRTANFTVAAPTPQIAKEIGDAAEHCRRVLAIEWLGKELPRWAKPCPIKARVSPELGAGGATSFVFDRGEVFNWRMDVQGSRERVLDSVIPHEVTHTIFASHFRQPLPRWADEGACTTVEHHSEIAKQERMLLEFLQTRQGIPFSAMFAMTKYPSNVLPLYAQGHSLTKFLIDQHGKTTFLDFLADGMMDNNWPRAVRQQYGYQHLLALQNSWMNWVRSGRPQLAPAGDLQLASAPRPMPAPRTDVIVRGQDPNARSEPIANATEPSVYSQITPTPQTASGATHEWPVDPPRRGGSVYDASHSGTLRR